MSSQHTLEVESARAPPETSQILHFLHAQTVDVSQVKQRGTEVSTSAAHEKAPEGGSGVTEATPVSVAAPLTGDDALVLTTAEPGAGSGSVETDQGISDQMNVWDEDEPNQENISSLADFEFDGNLLEENPSDSEPTFNLVEQPMPPPPPSIQEDQPQMNIIDLDPPYQPPPISHQHPYFPPGSTPAYVTSPRFTPQLQHLHPQIHDVPRQRTYDLPEDTAEDLDSETESEAPP